MSGPHRRNKVIVIQNTAWGLLNFRSGLIRRLAADGYDVVAVAPVDRYASQLPSFGCRFVPLPMDSSGTSPLNDLLLFWRFYALFRKERPSVVLGFTVKPNVFASLAAHLLGIPVVNNISGLGSVFIRTGWVTGVVRLLYRGALSGSSRVFFQNRDDMNLFVADELVRPDVAALVPGSGIDLKKYAASDVPERKGAFRFLLVARMLGDKGIFEYVEAARQLRSRWPEAEFCLLGFLDVNNPVAISRAQMDAWVSMGFVRYLGETDDIRPYIADADCVVLPSYREGTPRSLLEAAAMARPIITTDAVGCREVVDDGVNGYLCRPKDSVDLAEKMEAMLSLPAAARRSMGLRGREKVEREFDEAIVIGRYAGVIAGLCPADAVKPKVVIALNTAWNLVNFRAGLIRVLIAEGYEVVAVAPSDDYSRHVAASGCRYVPLPMDNHGVHPGRDLLLLFRYWRLLGKERPDAVLVFTIKPNIYGSLAAQLRRIPVVNNITGLGRVYARKSWLNGLVNILYRAALHPSEKVFFQNEEDRDEFISRRMVRSGSSDRLPGSGVDLARFTADSGDSSLPKMHRPFRFLLLSRLIWEKGVGVFVDAARIVKAEFPLTEFCLLGILDYGGSDSIALEQVREWEDEGIVRYLGQSDDVKSVLSEVDCVVLPSFYKEGVPRSLLEASAMGLPVITTDIPGCRDVVDDGKNGYLCRPLDVDDLALKMNAMLQLSEEGRRRMGAAGRRKVERDFDERIVIAKYMGALQDIVRGAAG